MCERLTQGLQKEVSKWLNIRLWRLGKGSGPVGKAMERSREVLLTTVRN